MVLLALLALLNVAPAEEPKHYAFACTGMCDEIVKNLSDLEKRMPNPNLKKMNEFLANHEINKIVFKMSADGIIDGFATNGNGTVITFDSKNNNPQVYARVDNKILPTEAQVRVDASQYITPAQLYKEKTTTQSRRRTNSSR